MLAMMGVPKPRQRLRCMLFKTKLHGRQEDLRLVAETISTASLEVAQSKRLGTLRLLVLKIGNELNQVRTV